MALLIQRKGHPRRGFARRGRYISPTVVGPTSFYAKDLGHRGRTPKSKRWYPSDKPDNVSTGWRKDLSLLGRRRALGSADAKFGSVKVFHDLLGTANVTTDKPTERKLRADLKWFARTKLNKAERRRLTSKARAR